MGDESGAPFRRFQRDASYRKRVMECFKNDGSPLLEALMRAQNKAAEGMGPCPRFDWRGAPDRITSEDEGIMRSLGIDPEG
jgi:hypothetical protein